MREACLRERWGSPYQSKIGQSKIGQSKIGIKMAPLSGAIFLCPKAHFR